MIRTQRKTGPTMSVAKAQRTKDAAYMDMVREASEAWKKRPPGAVTDDPWTNAVIAACSAKRNIELLAAYLETTEGLTREQSRDLVGVLRSLKAWNKKRPRGKPGGVHLRWQRPHYLVAWLVERLPRSKRTDERVSHFIRMISGWAFRRGKPPLDPHPGGIDHERVKALLRGSKSRRL